MAIRLQTLGTLCVQIDGEENPEMGARPVRTAFLVFLALEREASRERVMALLWPESDQDHARQALRQTLYALRRDLGQEWLESDRDTLRATGGLTADAREMLEAVEAGRMGEAAALYQGEFLAGFHLAESQPLQLWCDQWRARLTRLNRTARRTLIEEQVADGNLVAALAEARAWLDLDPLEDEAQHRVIEILFHLQRGEDALQEYETFEAVLAREGLEPLEETRILVERIRSSDTLLPPLPGHPAGPTTLASKSEKGTLGPFRRSKLPLILAGAASIAALVLIALWGPRRVRSSPETDPARVMVLPLVNETGDSTLDVVGILATEWITHAVVHMGPLQAVPSLDVLQMLGAGLTGERAARERGAGTLVSGLYFQVGDSLALHARITDLEQGEFWDALGPIWTPSDDPRPGLQELRDRVAGSLAVRFIPDAALPDPSVLNPPNYQAFRALLDAAEFIGRGDWAGALPHVERAARLDPTFYRAHLYVAAGLNNLGRPAQADSVLDALAQERDRFSPYERLVFQSGRAALRGDWEGRLSASREAARLDPGGTLHYISAGVALAAGSPREAIELFENLNPHCPWAPEVLSPWVGWTGAHHLLGRHQEELTEARRAREYHPARLEALFLEARALVALGRVDAVRRLSAETENMQPDRQWDVGRFLVQTAAELRAHGKAEIASEFLDSALTWYRNRQNSDQAKLSSRVQFADALFMAGELAESSAVLQALIPETPGNANLIGRLAVLAGRLGNEPGVRENVAALEANRGPYSYGVADYWLSSLSAWKGEVDQALLHLRRAIRAGQPRGIALHADPFLEPLWGHPGFSAAVAQEG